ncbi:alpha/beta hydrolase [Mesorhizobium sp. YIM 152430]|uniref:alpha/beta fold hydrolase n=1 Tax=Mesorhizobium sp. YIM 152430 TaxID=3031761 RepID=UPI0023DB016A|nr:alpha/beta hydrolase [Mesorhizobium sp. YIM 152430]MDF1600552.1 alpha/beta hydrolase [Mesorhizobium sp. YIM 152430]
MNQVVTYATLREPKLESAVQFVDNKGIRIATEARGTARRGTILLVMGATASMLWWPEKLIDHLSAAGYRVIRFDHRDTGLSTTNAPGNVCYDLNDLVGDILAILDAYGVEDVHLVGMSLGGYLSEILALRYPERVRTLTLIASEPVGLDYEAEGIAVEFMDHFGQMAGLDWSDQNAVENFMLGIARLSSGPAIPFDEKAALERIRGELDRTSSIQSAFNHSAIGGGMDQSLTAASLKLPVLVIHGTEDPIISVKAAYRTFEAVPGTELVLLEGRGHELPAKDIPEIAAAIVRQCSSCERSL